MKKMISLRTFSVLLRPMPKIRRLHRPKFQLPVRVVSFALERTSKRNLSLDLMSVGPPALN